MVQVRCVYQFRHARTESPYNDASREGPTTNGLRKSQAISAYCLDFFPFLVRAPFGLGARTLIAAALSVLARCEA